MDVGNASGVCALQDCFAGTPVGERVAENAHEYGFMIRCPKDREDWTGYVYEPWHLRYVGDGLVKDLQDQVGWTVTKPEPLPTLEEYFGLGPGPHPSRGLSPPARHARSPGHPRRRGRCSGAWPSASCRLPSSRFSSGERAPDPGCGRRPALQRGNLWVSTLASAVVLGLLWVMVRTRFLLRIVPR